MKKYHGRHATGKARFSRLQKVLIGIIAVLAVLLIVMLVVSWAVFEKPLLPNETEEPNTSQEDTQHAGLDYGDGIRPRAGGQRKSDDFYTVLILGRDTGGGGNTDTMLLASYDVTNQKATVMSIPRDTMVNIPWDIKRINAVYNYYGGGDKGIEALYREISQLVGFEPDYQVVVEWEAVGEIVDAIGGVYFDVPRNMNYDDGYQDLHIHQKKGYRKLSGSDAMQVLRYRHDNNQKYGYPDGDLGRIKTQQAFLTAMVQQLLQLQNVTKINQLAQVFEKNVTTDLSFKNICWFGQQAIMGGLKMSDVEFVTMPNENASLYSRTYGNYQSYVVPLADELLELVNEKLSPFTEEFTLRDLDIMSVNSNGSVRSSTGRVEDSRSTMAPSVPTDTSSNRNDDDDDHTSGKPSNNGGSGNSGNSGGNTATTPEPDDPGTGGGYDDEPGATPEVPPYDDPGTEPDNPVVEPDPEPSEPGPSEPDPVTDPAPETPGVSEPPAGDGLGGDATSPTIG